MITTAIKKIAADLKEWYLFKRTGLDHRQRVMKAWREENINMRACNIRDFFPNHKYIINVNPAKLNEFHPFFGDGLSEEFRAQFCYPNRPIEEHCHTAWMRGIWADDRPEYFIANEIGGGDYLFVATNSKEDATMIALLYK